MSYSLAQQTILRRVVWKYVVHWHYPHFDTCHFFLQQSDLTPPPELTGISVQTAKDYQEEERRLVYMLVTRAKKKFIFTNYTVRDNKNKAASKFSSHNPSKFIAEALGQPKVSSKKKAVEISPEVAEPTTTAKDFFNKTGPITLTPKIDALPNNLDFDQIRIFDRCPLHYYYQYVLKIPIQPTFLMAYQTCKCQKNFRLFPFSSCSNT